MKLNVLQNVNHERDLSLDSENERYCENLYPSIREEECFP